MNVFTYGSLMFAPVWQRVAGDAAHRSAVARLAGYRRFAIVAETYPALIAEAGAAVSGRLWLDVGPDELARLDAFEAGYQRQSVEVVAEGIGTVRAEVYVFTDRSRLSGDWDPAGFEREHAAGFAELHLAAVRAARESP